MAKSVAEKFIGALTELESASDVEQIVELFAVNCEVGNSVISEKFQGIEGARRFWTNYRHAFKDVCSIFENEIYFGNKARLDWTTEGKSKNGRRIKYEGVSILETEDGKITHFYAYFDQKKLKRQITEPNKKLSPADPQRAEKFRRTDYGDASAISAAE